MAGMTVEERIESFKRSKAAGGTGTSAFPAASGKTGNNVVADRIRKFKLEKRIGFDTFQKDLTSASDLVNTVYGGWQSADTMGSAKGTVSSMRNRLDAYKAYANSYSGNTDLAQFNSGVDQLIRAYDAALSDWDDIAGTYGKFVNADAYDKARKNYELSQKYGGLDYKGVQKAISENPEDAEWLSRYGVNAGYSDLREYQAELSDVEKSLDEVIKDGRTVPLVPLTNGMVEEDNAFMSEPVKQLSQSKLASFAEPVKLLSKWNYDTTKAKELMEARMPIENYAEELQAAMNLYELDHKFDLYKGLMDNEDFEELSAYQPGQRKGIRITTGKYEREYNLVNNPGQRSFNAYNDEHFDTGVSANEYNLEQITEDEARVFNYLYNRDRREGTDLLGSYIKDMKIVWNKRATEARDKRIEKLADDSVLASAVMTAQSVPQNILGGVSASVSNIASKIKGEEINPYSYGYRDLNTASAARGAVGNNIAEATQGMEIAGVNVPAFLYDTGLSIADSAVGVALLGNGYTVAASMGAAAQRAKELKEQGASENQIIMGSVASGVIEAFFEKFSIENLLKVKDADTIGKLVKETMKQMGIEASEEMFTEVANTVSDSIIRGNLSDAAQTMSAYMEQGYSEKEAIAKVALDLTKDVALAGIGGAISGGVMGGAKSAYEYAGYRGTGKTINGNHRTDVLVELARMSEDPNIQKYLKLLEEGATSEAQIGNLYTQIAGELDKDVSSKKAASVQEAIASRLSEMGEDSGDARNTAAAVYKHLFLDSSTGKLTAGERAALKGEDARTVIREIKKRAEWFRNSGISPEVLEAEWTRDRLEIVKEPKSETKVRAEQRAAEMSTGTETVDSATNERISLEGIRTDENGETILKTSAGEKRLADVTLTGSDAEIVAMAEGMDGARADLFVSMYQQGTDTEYYKDSFDLAYTYGVSAYGAESVIKNRGVLTAQQAVAVYKLGIQNSTAEIQARVDRLVKKHDTGITAGRFDDSAVNYEKLNKRQRAAVSFVKMFSEKTGVNVEFFESTADGNGRRTMENGRFDKSTGTIYLDVYAGLNENIFEDSIVSTLSHELTHWMQEKAPESYSRLSGLVMDMLARDRKASPEELVAAEQDRYQRAHGEEVSAEHARDELIARTCEDMLSNSEKVMEYLTRMDKKTARTIGNRMKEVIGKLKAWLSDLLKAYKSSSTEAKIVRRYSDTLTRMQKVWDEAFEKAVAANQAMKEGTEPVQPNDGSVSAHGAAHDAKEKVRNSRRDYSYEALVSKPDMKVTSVPNEVSADRKAVVQMAIANAKENGTINSNGNAMVYVADIGKEIMVSKRGVYHGMDRRFETQAPVLTRIGEVLKNAIQINELNPREETIRDSYILAGTASNDTSFFVASFVVNAYTNEIDRVDVLYSANVKKEPAALLPEVTDETSGTPTGSTISVARLLDFVKAYYPDILPEDVLRHYGYIRRPDGGIGKDVLFSERETESIYDAVGELQRVQGENERIREDIGRLRQKNRLERELAGGSVLSESHLASIAEHILEKADSRYSKESFLAELKDIYGYLQGEDVEWDIFMAKATDAAQRIIAERRGKSVQDGYARDILSMIRNTKVSFNDAQKAEAELAYGKGWRRNYFGRVAVTGDGVPLDTAWKEWTRRYPDVFGADTGSAEMATEVLYAYDVAKASSGVVDAYDKAEAARNISFEMYNQFWNAASGSGKGSEEIRKLKQEHRVAIKELRDRYLERYYAEHRDMEELYRQTIRNILQKRDEDIARVREYTKEYKEKLEKKAQINKITKKALKLNAWLVKNSKEEHVAEILKKPVAAVLKSLDFSSERLLRHTGEPTRKDISLSKAFEGLRDMVGSISDAYVNEDTVNDLYGYIDMPPDFAEFVNGMSSQINDILREVGDNEYILNRMSTEQLKDMNKLLNTLTHMVTSANKALAGAHGKTIKELAEDTMAYTDKLGPKSGFSGKVAEFFHFDNTLPVYAFDMFGEGGQKIFEGLQDGWDRFAYLVKQIMEYAGDAYTAKEVRKWSREIHEFELADDVRKDTVRITTAQIMSLYCLQKREQAAGHLLGCGIRVTDFKDGMKTVSQPNGAILMEGDIRHMVAELTPRQREVADTLQDFMGTVCAKWGNEVSMVRFGYKMFDEANYFPITSDKNQHASDTPKENAGSLFRLLNMSFTKSLAKNANSRIMIDNIFDVFADHASNMAKYNALALPVLDAFRWHSYHKKGSINENKGDSRKSSAGVKQSLAYAYGDGANHYITQLLEDLNGTHSGGMTNTEKLSRKLISNYKVAAVGANLRVALLQPTSYVRASAVINPKYLVRAFAHKPQIQKAKDTCGMAQWKSMGFYSTNISKGVAAQIKHEETWVDKWREGSMKLAELGDSVTWGYLYNACEAEISDTNPGLSGTDKDKAVAKRLREVIYRTQVVDSTMTRTQTMRDSSTWNQVLTSFMSEPMVSYNLLRGLYARYNADKRIYGNSSAALKRNGRNILRATMAYLVTNLCAALAGGFMDTLRDDEEKEGFAELFFANVADNALSDVVGMLPLMRDLASVYKGFGTGRMDMQGLESAVNATKKLMKSFEKGELTYSSVYSAICSVAKAPSQLTGLPVSNAMRDFKAIWNSTIGEVFESMRIK